ncbi:nucleotidyltransferase domain-containing protein [Lachnospiraceae bacterium 54-11]
MNDRNEKIIDAIKKKADALCPDSLALIGVYGSVAAGDEYEKSDLDLIILINDEKGQVLADGFILDDVDIGYDIYCTGWDMLEKDAQCEHAHLSKLFDSMTI